MIGFLSRDASQGEPAGISAYGVAEHYFLAKQSHLFPPVDSSERGYWLKTGLVYAVVQGVPGGLLPA